MPFASKVSTPNFLRVFEAPLLGADKLKSIFLSVVPAWELFIPTLPSRPAIAEASSKLIPAFLATGPTYFIVSPSFARSVFAVVNVFASISLTFPISLAFKPKPLKISLAILLVIARSVWPALARFKRSGIAFIVSFALNPAIAKYCIPCPTSLALNVVEAPSCLAVEFSLLNSSFVAPLKALTLAIELSNSIPALKGAAIAYPIASLSSICPFALSL